MRRIRATLPGSPSAHTEPPSSRASALISRSVVPSSNSASTARLSSPSSTGSERSSICASMPAQVQQVGGQPTQPARLPPGATQQRRGRPPDPARRSGGRRPAARASRPARPAACAARARRWPRRLAAPPPASQPLLHQRERPGQVTHLVPGPVDRNLDAGPLLGQLRGGLAQPPQSADHRRRRAGCRGSGSAPARPARR